jgi:glucose-1-phosphate cytidylyltransferase
MKAVILAGGLGSRISEESHTKPKPMITIGSKPILWHILKIYSHFGINNFIICCGHKGYMIKEYFANYFLHTSDVTFDFTQDNRMHIHQRNSEPWKVTLVDTGELTQTGGRIARIKNYVDDGTFFLTYGDGVANVDMRKLLDQHLISKREVTLTAVQPPGRYGALRLNQSNVLSFEEKPDGDNAWINGGFFVLESSIFRRAIDDKCSWENDILPRLAAENQLGAYRHPGFWQPMDTLRDRMRLEELWESGKAPWKIW